MNSVFLLWYTDPETDEEMLIGVYRAKNDAEAAIERSRVKSGFRDHPEAFEICEYILDKDHWTEGFVRMSAQTE